MTNPCFCTLFNSNYWAKGMLTLRSLLHVCPDAQIYVLAMDDMTAELLRRENSQQLHVVTMAEFESPEILNAKSNRNQAEYCWTCASAFIYYCMTTFKLSSCVYIDADLYFYTSPLILLQELGKDNDVMITEHRYTPQYDMSVTSGKYCVQFMYFRNTLNGMHILKWWRDACLEWCYNRFEDGKFGDQKYLDDWTTRFKGVHVLQHEGGGLAPWNIQQYNIIRREGTLYVQNKQTGVSSEVVFYHFHHLRNYYLRSMTEFRMGPYPIAPEVKELIYLPYIKELIEQYHQYSIHGFDPLGSAQIETTRIQYLLHKIKAYIHPKDKIVWHV